MTALAERLLVGAIAQLVERVLCKHEVVGSIPSGSTKKHPAAIAEIQVSNAWLRRRWQKDIVN